jgi:hypothetical protein
MKEVKSFTIDRANWLQGEGSADSYLIRSRDGKQCCLGFYLLSCGLPEEYLTNRRSLIGLSEKMMTLTPDWLLDENTEGVSWACHNIMLMNDDCTFAPLSEKEASITTSFKAAGIEVSFTGSYPTR